MSARRAGGIRVVLRAAATAPVASTVVAVLVALVSFAGAALPAVLDDARTATVHRALSGLRADVLDPTAKVRGLPTAGGGSADAGLGHLADTWGGTVSQLRRVHDRLPQPLHGVLGDPQVYITLDGTAASPEDGSPRPANRIEITLDPLYASRIHIVDGALPRPVGDGARVVQIALSREAADVLAWPVGERRTVRYPSDPMTVVLSGIYEARDAADAAWRHQRTGLYPDIEQTGLGNPIHLAMAYAAPQLLPGLGPWVSDAGTTTWMPLRTDRIDGPEAAALAAQLRGFAATPLSFDVRAASWFTQALSFRSSAPQLLEAGAARGDAMGALVALVAIGPLTVAIAAIAMTGRMLTFRRRGIVRLARARGASVGRLRALLSGEGLILGMIGAGAGAFAAAVTTGWAGPVSLAVPALAAVAPALAAMFAGVSAAARIARIDLGVGDGPVRRRRLFIEGGIALGAGAILVAAVARSDPRADAAPVLLAAPVAVFAVGCILVLRLVPPAIRGVGRLMLRDRGVMAVLGPAHAARGRTLPVIPVLASLVCLATALFAGVASATVAAGIQSTAQSRTGADLRVTASQVGAEAIAAVRAIPGVRTVAPVYADVQVPARGTAQWMTVTVLAVDPAEFAAVQHGIPGALRLPGGVRGTDGEDVPAVASEAVARSVGDGSLEIHGTGVHVLGTAASLAFASTSRWIVVDRVNAPRLIGPTATVHTLLVALESDADAVAVASAATAAVGAGAAAVVPAQVAADIADDPALQTVRLSLWAALAAVVVLLVLSASMTLLRGAPERGRVLGLLAALGYPRRRGLPLAAWEVGPALLLALPVGMVAGWALSPLLLSGVDLTRFVGGSAQPAILVPAWMPWAVGGGFLLVAVAAVAAAAAVAARVTAAMALRRIDEEGET
ncbi:FtsX-like permease family protein [Microbacterium sp. SYP-A9085]|uniref:FtsX-like permease family protein n=1 Tax=Microbacterium sp. SYP-A9085 TaxID=2664454 RepID=UPI00129BD376|nr:FtsX-like permease family protein [Microbacterium sp. SYP-A9085]MRH28197.1 FtsX-like permease family protein [Microbacterium sp. SYP-A9085]